MRILGNIVILKVMLAKNEMGLLNAFMNSFEELFGMFAVPNAFLAFSLTGFTYPS